MVSTNISFMKEKNGYDKTQVDNYVKKLSEAYQTTYYEYLDISGKYKALKEEHENMEKPQQTSMNPDVAAKTLINAELLVQKIISEAQAEATKLIEDAKNQKETATTEAATIMDAARKMLDEAHNEANTIKETANNKIDDATEEAATIVADAKKDLKQAKIIMEQALREAEQLLAAHSKQQLSVVAA